MYSVIQINLLIKKTKGYILILRNSYIHEIKKCDNKIVSKIQLNNLTNENNNDIKIKNIMEISDQNGIQCVWY